MSAAFSKRHLILNHPEKLDICRGPITDLPPGVLEDQRNVLETHWPPDRLVIYKAYGLDWVAVFRARPHTTDMQNVNILILPGILRRQCQSQSLHSLSKYAVEGIHPYSTTTNTFIKMRPMKENSLNFRSKTVQVSD